MTRSVKFARLFLVLAGLVPLAVGIMHLFLPSFGFDDAVLAQFTPASRSHFVDLALYAIAVFLLAFAFLTFYFAARVESSGAIVFSVVQSVVWVLRSILEVIFPVEIALFGMTGLSPRILGVSIAAALLYAVSVYFAVRARRGA